VRVGEAILCKCCVFRPSKSRRREAPSLSACWMCLAMCLVVRNGCEGFSEVLYWRWRLLGLLHQLLAWVGSSVNYVTDFVILARECQEVWWVSKWFRPMLGGSDEDRRR